MVKHTMYILAIFSVVSILSCRKTGDRHIIVSLPAAGFVSRELIADTSYITDTVLTQNLVQFTPSQSYDSVSWTIQPSNFQRKVPVLTTRFMDAGLYTITMKGYKTAVEGVKVETVVRTLRVEDREGGTSYLGNYRGAVSGMEHDSFEVKVYRISENLPAYPSNTHVLSNLPKGCLSELLTNSMAPLTTLNFGFRMFVTDAPRCFPGGKAIGTIQENTLTVDFTMSDISKPFDPNTGYPLLKKRFVGRRL